MKPPSLLTRLQSVFSVLRRRQRPRPGRKPPPRRLQLEGLEDRSVTGGGILET